MLPLGHMLPMRDTARRALVAEFLVPRTNLVLPRARLSGRCARACGARCSLWRRGARSACVWPEGSARHVGTAAGGGARILQCTRATGEMVACIQKQNRGRFIAAGFAHRGAEPRCVPTPAVERSQSQRCALSSIGFRKVARNKACGASVLAKPVSSRARLGEHVSNRRGATRRRSP